MKLVILQMIQIAGQIEEYHDEDPHTHIKDFYKICKTFNKSDITQEDNAQRFFLSLWRM